jgi:hypothetical protein
MYTLLELESKTLAALKEIGHELNVLPEDDRRRRQSWIDALVNVNPPLLQLLEVAPAASVEQVQPIIETVEASPAVEAEPVQVPIESKFGRIVYPRPAQGAIVQVAKNSPGVDVDRAQEPIVQVIQNSPGVDPGVDVDRAQEPIVQAAKNSPGVDVDRAQEPIIQVAKNSPGVDPGVDVDRAQEPIVQAAKNSPGVDVDRAQEPIIQVAKNSPGVDPGVDVDRAQELIVQAAENTPGVEPVEEPNCVECFDDGFIEDESGFLRLCQCCNKPKLSDQKTQRAIAPVAKNLPGSRSKTSIAHQLLELFKSSAHIIEDAPAVKTEETVSESAIVPAAKKLPRSESDPNPILTGILLSDRFVARYSPPQPENIHFKADSDGQLSLLDFEVELVNEPPEPDDFSSIDAFNDAMARWDAENAEALTVSMDSMCEWAPCPYEWYEPKAENLLLKASSRMELSPPAIECSITSANFTIPTFDAWCDRANRQTDTDEPPDTGISVRLPKPKPPKFPPQSASQPLVNQVSRNYPETIPKLFHRVAAGSSAQPGRSPPGGDAM